MKKTALRRGIKIATIVFGILAVGLAAAQKVLNWWTIRQLSREIPESACSIGVIGGADGPTAIFISTQYAWGNPYVWAGGFAVLSLIGLIALLILRKQNP